MSLVFLYNFLKKRVAKYLPILFTISMYGAQSSYGPLYFGLLSHSSIYGKKKVKKVTLIRNDHESISVGGETFSAQELYDNMKGIFWNLDEGKADVKLEEQEEHQEVHWVVTKSDYVDDTHFLSNQNKVVGKSGLEQPKKGQGLQKKSFLMCLLHLVRQNASDSSEAEEVDILGISSKIKIDWGLIDPFFGLYCYSRLQSPKLLFLAQKAALMFHQVEKKQVYEFLLPSSSQPKTLLFSFKENNRAPKIVEKNYYDPDNTSMSINRKIVKYSSLLHEQCEEGDDDHAKRYYDFFLMEKENFFVVGDQKSKQLIKVTKLERKLNAYYENFCCKGCKLIDHAYSVIKTNKGHEFKEHFRCRRKKGEEKEYKLIMRKPKQALFKGFSNGYRIPMEIKKEHDMATRTILVIPKMLLFSKPKKSYIFSDGYTDQEQKEILTFYYLSELLDKTKKIKKWLKEKREFYFQENAEELITISIEIKNYTSKVICINRYRKEKKYNVLGFISVEAIVVIALNGQKLEKLNFSKKVKGDDQKEGVAKRGGGNLSGRESREIAEQKKEVGLREVPGNDEKKHEDVEESREQLVDEGADKRASDDDSTSLSLEVAGDNGDGDEHSLHDTVAEDKREEVVTAAVSLDSGASTALDNAIQKNEEGDESGNRAALKGHHSGKMAAANRKVADKDVEPYGEPYQPMVTSVLALGFVGISTFLYHQVRQTGEKDKGIIKQARRAPLKQ